MSIGQGNITVQSKKEAGEATQANNGLTLTGNLVQLGGGLIQNTYIGLNSGFEFAFQGSGGDNVFLLDEVNDIYFFGVDTAGDRVLVTGWSFDEANIIEGRAAGKVGIRIVEAVGGFEAYLGDVNNDGNGTKIFIDDNNGDISLGDLSDNLNSIKLKISNQFQNITMGDPDGEQNGTTLTIDDSTQSVEITNVPAGAITNDYATFDGDQIKKIPAPIESGTYTPTITNDANAQNISTDGPWQYMRVGNVVTVSGNFNVEAIAAAGTQTTVFFNPPIFSYFPTGVEAGGTAWGTVSMINGGQVTITFSNTLQCKWFAAANGAADYVAIHFTYLIVEAP